MQKCSRYIFNYTSPPDIVEDFILRSDDLASQTYGRDKHFSRLNQVLEQARFLGWPLPRFGSELPEELTEIPPAGVDHIFENQSKLLVDIATTTQILLESGKYCPLKMIPGTTAAGDLVWRCHLLLDTEGTPYIQRNKKKLRVKTKGTKIVCQAETLQYDEGYVSECFGGDGGVFPVPFLPEFFSDRPIAQEFSPEPGVIEVVYIHEEVPVKILANTIVPWYRPLEINYTKALSGGGEEFDNDVTSLVSGWNELKENQAIDVEDPLQETFNSKHSEDSEEDEAESEDISLTNLITDFTEVESKKFADYEKVLAKSGIGSKAEADELRNDPKHKDRAEKWLLAAVNRLRIIANSASKIGAVIDLVNRHVGQQMLIIQPRQKWAAKLSQILTQRGIQCFLFDSEKSKSQINKFYDGEIEILITSEVKEELLVDDLVIISVSSINTPDWLDLLNSTHKIYMICNKELGYNDSNYIAEKDGTIVTVEDYQGPSFDILKLSYEDGKSEKPKPEKPEKTVEKEAVVIPEEPKVLAEVKNPGEPTVTQTSETENTEKNTEKAKAKPKFKVKVVGQTQGRPKTASSYEKALELAQKLEADDKKCEIYGPDSEEALYISGIGELNK